MFVPAVYTIVPMNQCTNVLHRFGSLPPFQAASQALFFAHGRNMLSSTMPHGIRKTIIFPEQTAEDLLSLNPKNCKKTRTITLVCNVNFKRRCCTGGNKTGCRVIAPETNVLLPSLTPLFLHPHLRGILQRAHVLEYHRKLKSYWNSKSLPASLCCTLPLQPQLSTELSQLRGYQRHF